MRKIIKLQIILPLRINLLRLAIVYYLFMLQTVACRRTVCSCVLVKIFLGMPFHRVCQPQFADASQSPV